jgi:4-amino-4-deoxy-L-arabinose transferase-like glycosyltransferase
MHEYMKRHEAFVRAVLASQAAGIDWPSLGRYHDAQIRYMQHERLIHLLVTLFVGLFTLIAVLHVATRPSLAVGVLAVLLTALFVPYIAHYYRLENGVQRWYELANDIERRGKAEAPQPPIAAGR